MARWVLPLLFLATTPALDITVAPQPGKSFMATFTGKSPGASAGEFRGNIALNGSHAAIPLMARAERTGQGLRLSATLRYADIPPDWFHHSKPDAFDYSIRGEVAGTDPVAWDGTQQWDRVAVEGDLGALSELVQLTSLELTALAPRRSEGRAVLAVENPFSFPIAVSAASYRLRVNGQEVGGGATSGRTLRPRKRSALELPFTVDRGSFLAAAGPGWSVGASLDSEVDVWLAVRLSSIPLSLPLKLPGRMGTDGARSSVFALPEGASSVSPR